MIKLADTLAPMADFPAVEAKDVAFNDNKSLQEKYDNGELGGGSGSGEENKIDSISINGSPITPDENKNVDITVPDVTNDLTDELKSSYDDAVTAKHTHENGTVLDGITAEKVESWDKAEENVQSDWNETDDTADGFIKNKPTIPDITGLATETYVDNKVADYTKTVDLADVATSGSYNDLADKPTIPSLDGYAKTSEIPTKVSELENDSNYLSSIPEEYVTDTELEAKGYLTEHQDISNLVEKEDGKGLSSNDYTTEEKNKLAGLENYNDTALSNRVKTVEDEVPNLATKTYVGEQIANAEHLKREIVTVLPSDEEASDNIIYMLKVESATGNDKYQEYMKIDSTVQMVGDTSVDLTDYAKSAEIPTTVAELTDSADYAKKTDIPTSLPADGGNADTVNNHTVKSDVPENAVFTDTVYDDTDIKAEIAKKADATYTPHIDETTKNWFIGDVDTGILAEGTNGTDGTTYTPSIGEVTTVDSTELASATVSVNTETKEAVFNFAIPKGNKGLDGVQISDNETVEDKTWSSKKTSSKIAEKIDKTNILTALDDAATDDQVYSAKLVNDELDKKANNDEVLKKTDIVDNLTSTDTDKPLSANQGKILNDTKLNKTDANKLNCVTIDNVSLKEYILTNFTEIGKTYYLIAKTTCTDLPKASNFYITVETPGMYTYKVTAKELNDSNGKYVCTYRTISSSWTAWEKVLITGDITTTISDSSTDTQVPSAKAVNELNLRGTQINQSVIDKYGTEILKYPFGRWYIDGNEIAGKFSDMPWATACIIDITSPIISTRNPWDNTWAYRNYRVQTIENKGTFVRQLESRGTPGVLKDTGWQKVCTTSVADVPNTVIVSKDTKVKLNSNCYYTVINGVCYVTLWGFTCTEAGQYVVNSSMPKTRLTMNGLCTHGSNGYEGGCAYIYYDGNDNNKLYVEAKTANEPLYGSFSYPVAES